MTQAQVKRLGTVITKARERAGYSQRALAELIDMPRTSLQDLEYGLNLDPAPDGLARIAEALNIAPAKIDRLSGGKLASLPGPRTYFRAKLQLTAEQAAQVERYIERLRRQT